MVLIWTLCLCSFWVQIRRHSASWRQWRFPDTFRFLRKLPQSTRSPGYREWVHFFFHFLSQCISRLAFRLGWFQYCLTCLEVFVSVVGFCCCSKECAGLPLLCSCKCGSFILTHALMLRRWWKKSVNVCGWDYLQQFHHADSCWPGWWSPVAVILTVGLPCLIRSF